MAHSHTCHRLLGESGLVQRVRARLGSLPVARPLSLVLGVSGGVDSLALVAVLSDLGRQGAARVVAVHVDHRLRDGSGEEQERVATLAATLGVELEAKRLAPELRARHPGVGLEEAARRERFGALAGVARERRADAIALGHHEGDQVETVLMHLLRGSGLHGMSGMAEWSKLRIPWWTPPSADVSPHEFAIWRPLLAEPKATLESFVRGIGLEPVVDPSNASVEFTRNRIRHELLPLIEGIAPGSTASIVRFAGLASAEDAYLESVAKSEVGSIVDADGQLVARRLGELDVVIQRRVVQTWLQSALPPGVELGQERLDAVRTLGLSGRGGATIQIGSGWQVVRGSDRLRLERVAM